MGQKTYLSQNEDFPLLNFLWKWKLATTAWLSKKIFPTLTESAAYLRLWRLARAGYIEAHTNSNGKNYYWILTEKGFDALRGELPPLREEGFRSEHPAHDLLSSAIHLGEWNPLQPNGQAYVTEQQLRRFDPEFLPEWLPRHCSHVADGYWHLHEPRPQTIALEVEITQKRRLGYEKAIWFYRDRPQITSVLWVVGGKAITNQILAAIHKGTDGESNHNFVWLKDILYQGWHAKVSFGRDQTKSIYDLLANCGQPPDKPVFTQFALDTRKSPFRSNRSKDEILLQFLDWIGL